MIEAAELTKSFGDHHVLRGVSVQVAPGEIFALLGPNGAGKTTTVRIMATLTRADSGSVRIAGHDVVRDRSAVRRSIALTGQYAALDDSQTGTENLRMMARLAQLSRRDAKARSAELLERFDLMDAADRRVSTYSGGMRRRLDLAASLVARPAVIFLDEPTTGLDPRSRQDVWTAVAELARAGTTVLLTTQYLEEADRLADRIAVIDNGTVVAEGTADSLKRQVAGHRLEATARDADSFAALRDQAGARTLEFDPATRLIAVPVEDDAAAHPRPARRTRSRLGPDRALRRALGVARRRLPRPHRAIDHREGELTMTAVADLATLSGRCLRLSQRNVEALVTALALPVILMLMFVYLFGGAIRSGLPYVDYVVPGVLLVCAGFGAGTTAVSVSADLKNGIVDRFRSMDVRGEALVTGHVVASVLRNLVSSVLVIGVAVAIGFRSHASAAAWLSALAIFVLFVLALSWVCAALGMVAGSPEAASGLTFAISFLPYPSSAFVPIDTMPSWLQGFARHQPVTCVVDALRGLLTGGPVASAATQAVLWSIGIGAVAIMLSGVLFRRRTA